MIDSNACTSKLLQMQSLIVYGDHYFGSPTGHAHPQLAWSPSRQSVSPGSK